MSKHKIITSHTTTILFHNANNWGSYPICSNPPGLSANDLFKFYQFFYKNCTLDLFEKNLLNKTYEHLSDGQKQRLKIDLALKPSPTISYYG
ncbi:hypothetical protein HpCK89_07380 [Helicobacter pylori]